MVFISFKSIEKLLEKITVILKIVFNEFNVLNR